MAGFYPSVLLHKAGTGMTLARNSRWWHRPAVAADLRNFLLDDFTLSFPMVGADYDIQYISYLYYASSGQSEK